MTLQEVSPKEYAELFPHPQHIFNSVPFGVLNSHKVSDIKWLCFFDGKPRLGLTVGKDSSGEWRAPFSAPFSGFDFNKVQSAETVVKAVELLKTGFRGLRLTLPPAFYSPDMNSRTFCALAGCGAKMTADWNYHIPLDGDYLQSIGTDSRKKLKRARRSDFKVMDVSADPMRGYSVIAANRRQKGYTLRMSADDVLATTGGVDPVVKADFFVLTDGVRDAAAAMVYHVTHEIAQVVYWGDDENVDGCDYPVNLLAAELVSIYKEKGFGILDIGPSSSVGIPSYGLCNFKDSVGCTVTVKPTFIL